MCQITATAIVVHISTLWCILATQLRVIIGGVQ